MHTCPMNLKTKKELRLKDKKTGEIAVFLAGITVEVVEFKERGVQVRTPNGKTVSFPYERCSETFNGFEKVPSVRKLEKMSNDAICTTPLGNRVEPDGHDEHGCPSWLLVMGLI